MIKIVIDFNYAWSVFIIYSKNRVVAQTATEFLLAAAK